MNLAARLSIVVLAVSATAFAGPPEQTHTGCVMQTPAGWFTFCEPDACSTIRGAGVDAKLAGHKVTAKGTMQPATAETGAVFNVTHIVSVGDKCDEICSPNPPHHRGLGGKDKPGSEGGTPGMVAPPSTPPVR